MKRNQDIKFKFGLAIRKRRLELNISQEELADRASMHRTYVGDIERGKRNVSLVNIEKLANALNISISNLFTEYDLKD